MQKMEFGNNLFYNEYDVNSGIEKDVQPFVETHKTREMFTEIY